jgi:hypothetical protein
MKKYCYLFFLVLTSQAHAYDGMSSEISHAIGGAFFAGAIETAFEEHEHRALIGFSISTALFAVVEGRQMGSGARRHSQMLDIYYHTMGSALGAWATDKFILLPILTPSKIGVAYTQSF